VNVVRSEPGAPTLQNGADISWLVYQQRRNSPADGKMPANRHGCRATGVGLRVRAETASKKNGNGSVERREHGDHRNLFESAYSITKDECAGIEKGVPAALRGRFRVRKSERRTLCSKNPERNEAATPRINQTVA